MKTTLTLIMSLILSSRVCAGVLPPDAVVDGKTIGEWSAEWWKWMFSCPTNSHPLIDTDGVNANNCQPDGPVFFLAGSFLLPSTVTRSFTVPEGAYLFVPLLPVLYEYDPSIVHIRPPDPPDLAAELYASIDGIAVTNLRAYRTLSPMFTFTFPSCDNIMTISYGRCISGLVENLSSDGYWLMLEPLPPGQHTINFGGSFVPPFNLHIDITDHITVVPAPLSEGVGELAAQVDESNLHAHRKRSLLASLEAALVSFESQRFPVAINQLQAFQRKVRAQIAPTDPTRAEELINAAQNIIGKANNERVAP